MSAEYSKSSHVVNDIKYHIIWVTKYQYKVLGGNMSKRLRELIRQGCEARGITIVQCSIGRPCPYTHIVHAVWHPLKLFNI